MPVAVAVQHSPAQAVAVHGVMCVSITLTCSNTSQSAPACAAHMQRTLGDGPGSPTIPGTQHTILASAEGQYAATAAVTDTATPCKCCHMPCVCRGTAPHALAAGHVKARQPAFAVTCTQRSWHMFFGGWQGGGVWGESHNETVGG